MLLLVPVLACSSGPAAERLTLRFVSASGSPSEPFSMEIAASEPERRRGLMYRRSLGTREGMIFLFPQSARQSFWMKNTFIPLDMVFVDSQWRVVGVLENVPPLTETPRSVDAASQYVLEFPGGVMGSLGIRAGDTVKVEGSLPAVR